MRQRDFLWAFAGATVVPLEARAEPMLPTIGCLSIYTNLGYVGVLTTGSPVCRCAGVSKSRRIKTKSPTTSGGIR